MIRKKDYFLIFYSLAWGILIFSFIMWSPKFLSYLSANMSKIVSVESYMPARIRFLQGAVAYVFGERETPYEIHDNNASYYYYLAFIGKLVNIKSAEIIYSLTQSVMAGIAFFLVPLILYYTFHSKLIGILTPVIILIGAGKNLVHYKTADYWGLAWVVIVALPILILLIKRNWDRISFYLYLALLLVVAIGNVFRMHSSLAILCVAIPCLIVKVKRKDGQTVKKYLCMKGGLILSCLVSYYLLISIIPSCYMEITGNSGFIYNVPPWHTVYISNGWEKNPYEIIYLDECAKEKVEELAPGTLFFTEQYFETLKQECFRMWKENPKWFLQSYIRKIRTCVQMVTKENKKMVLFFFVLYLLLFGIIKKYFKRDNKTSYRKWGFLMIICVMAIEIIFPLLAVPRNSYNMGMSAAWGMVLLYLICYDLADIKLLLANRKSLLQNKL